MSENKLLGIWGRQEWGGEMKPYPSANLVADKGMREDASFGSKRQITIIEESVWNSVNANLGANLPPETRRANLLIRGLNLKETEGKVLQIGACRVKIRGETKPCELMDQFFDGLRGGLKPDWNGGAWGDVLDSGKISIGDPVRWVE